MPTLQNSRPSMRILVKEMATAMKEEVGKDVSLAECARDGR
jgi:hypothetical protein